MYHLFSHIKCQKLFVSSDVGFPQLAKTKISTSVKKKIDVCHNGRFSGSGIMFICSSARTFSSFR